MYKRALISVFDKTGLESFLKPLVNSGLKLVSTTGTAKFLQSKGFVVTDVKELTGFPEVMSGRVKTLHSSIYMAVLYRRWVKEDKITLKKHGIKPFDLVVANLYPFEKKSFAVKEEKELAEWIDIGGPCLLRAAAKNYFHITTVIDPKDYPIIAKGSNLKIRKHLAAKVFNMVSTYDSLIAKKLEESEVKTNNKNTSFFSVSKKQKIANEDSFFQNKQEFMFKARFFKNLRYGENPHQQAFWYKTISEGIHRARKLQGKAISYNNLMDFCAAVSAVKDFKAPCVVAVKHSNPCGAALGSVVSRALEKTLESDPLSIFGGVLAFNRIVDEVCARQIGKIFLEGIIAPGFSAKALEVLKNKKLLRLLQWPGMLKFKGPRYLVHEIMGGMLVQTKDQVKQDFSKNWQVLGKTPSVKVKKDLLFAWKICAHLKSNAIAVVKNLQSLGLGMGQVSRIDAVQLALQRACRFHPKKQNDLVLASDAFFPFMDSIELAKKYKVSWIIQPGGSIKDSEVIKKALKLNINMILTGTRHFKH